MRRLLRAAVPVTLTAALLAGCGHTSVVEQLQGRNAGASRVQPYESLTDLLPNRTYRAGDGPQWSYSSSVVVGHFTSVEPGHATSGQDDPSRVDVPFESPDAASRTFHAIIAVDRLVAGRALRADDRVGFALSPDLSTDDVQRDLKDLGTVLLFLCDSPVFDYAPNVLGTVQDGELIAQVDPDGTLTFPAHEAADDAGSTRVRGVSVDQLAAAALTPGESISLDPSGAEILSRKPAQ